MKRNTRFFRAQTMKLHDNPQARKIVAVRPRASRATRSGRETRHQTMDI
jgi:hypothetical protein